LLPGIEDLANLYANADVGIVFSTTNPSLVPYEMMACGLPIVDLGRPGNETNYAGRSDIALLADPDPAAMARQIKDLLSDSEERLARSRRGLEFVQTFPSEEEMARRIEGLILHRMKTRQRTLGEAEQVLTSRA
jgi:glycosyltransferase involved in cell wall biosynthesis